MGSARYKGVFTLLPGNPLLPQVFSLPQAPMLPQVISLPHSACYRKHFRCRIALLACGPRLGSHGAW